MTDELEEEIQRLGKGIALQEADNDPLTTAWDIEIGGDGDIAIAAGVDELEKDISFKVARVIETSRGQNITRNFLARVESVVENVMNRDERIREVIEVTAVEDDDEADQYNIEAEATSITGDRVVLDI